MRELSAGGWKKRELFPTVFFPLSLSLFFFSALAGAVLEERKKERQRIAFIPYVLEIS